MQATGLRLVEPQPISDRYRRNGGLLSLRRRTQTGRPAVKDKRMSPAKQRHGVPRRVELGAGILMHGTAAGQRADGKVSAIAAMSLDMEG